MAKREANCGKPEKQEEQTHKQEAQSRALLLALRAVGQELREACSFLGYDSGPSEVPRELLGRWAKGPAGNPACLPLWRRSCTPHRLWALSQPLVLLNHGARRKINTFGFLLAPDFLFPASSRQGANLKRERALTLIHSTLLLYVL